MKSLLEGRGYDADWVTDALKDKRLQPRTPAQKQPEATVKYDRRRHKRSSRNEIMFGRLKYRRCVWPPYDRCSKVFLSAIALAAIVIYWL